MNIFASKHDSKGPLYIAASLTRDELVSALQRAGLPVPGGMTLDCVRFSKDTVTLELVRTQSDRGTAK